MNITTTAKSRLDNCITVESSDTGPRSSKQFKMAGIEQQAGSLSAPNGGPPSAERYQGPGGAYRVKKFVLMQALLEGTVQTPPVVSEVLMERIEQVLHDYTTSIWAQHLTLHSA